MAEVEIRRKINIGEVVQKARVFNFKNVPHDAMSDVPLPQVVSRLFSLLRERGIDYMLVGGIAMLQYVEGRNTEDIDLIVAEEALEKLPEITLSGRDAYFARGTFSGLKIDFLLTNNPFFEHVRRRHVVRHSFYEEDILTASVEGLLLLKGYALPSLYRQGSFTRVGLYENDIATLIYAYRPDLGTLFEEWAPFMSAADLSALRGIIDEIMERIERFSRGLGEDETAEG